MNDEQRPPNLNSLEPPLQAAVNAVLAASTPEDAIERVKVRAKELAATIVSPSHASGYQGRVWRASRSLHCWSDRRGCGFGCRFCSWCFARPTSTCTPKERWSQSIARTFTLAPMARSMNSGRTPRASRSSMDPGSRKANSC